MTLRRYQPLKPSRGTVTRTTELPALCLTCGWHQVGTFADFNRHECSEVRRLSAELRAENKRLSFEQARRSLGGRPMTSEPATFENRAVPPSAHWKDDPPHDVDEFCDDCIVPFTEATEARAAAERDVAALRVERDRLLRVYMAVQSAREFITLHRNNVVGGQRIETSKVLTLIEEALAEAAHPAAAEPEAIAGVLAGYGGIIGIIERAKEAGVTLHVATRATCADHIAAGDDTGAPVRADTALAAEKERVARLRSALSFSAVPALIVFEKENSGVKAVVEKCLRVLAETDDAAPAEQREGSA